MRIAIILCAALAACGAEEPRRATLAGRVLDPSGAVVPESSVELRSAGGGQALRAVTDRQGRFAIPAPGGVWQLTVEAGGFARYVREGVALAPGETTDLDVVLAVAAHAEAVTVTAKAPPLEASLETRATNFREVLEIREVRESAARDVGEALARLEGLWKVRKGGIANDVVLRGFQQDNLNVLIDGLRIYGACPNNMDPAAFHVDFAEIQQVEVIKGAFDIRNQGSLGGTVNIVNKEPEAGLRFTPSFSTGSFGYVNPALTASASTEKIQALAGYSFRRSDPYRDGAGRRFTEYANFRPGSRQAFDARTGWFRTGVALSHRQRFDVSYTRQQGGETLYPYLMMDALYDNADRAGAAWQLSPASGPLARLRVESYFTRVKHWMTDEFRLSSVGMPRPYSMATFAATKAAGGRVEAELPGLVAGVETYRRNWNAVNSMRMGNHYMDQAALPDVNVTVAGAYAQYRRVIERLQLSAGARLDTARSEARSAGVNTDLYWAYKSTRSLAHRDTSPSANLWLSYALPRGLELFAGGGRTVRVPDPQERYFGLRRSGSDWVGNPELRPTTNTEADAGLTYRGRWFSLRPTLFYSFLRDFIIVHNQARLHDLPGMGMLNPAARSFTNTDARLYGGEVSYSAGFGRALLVSGGLSWSRGIKDARPAERVLDRNFAEAPPLKARTALRYGNRLWFGEVEAMAAGAQNRVDSDLREQRTPGYGLLNLKAGIHGKKLNLAAGIDNLFDRYYYEHFSYQRDPFRFGVKVPEPGRSVYTTVSFAF